MIYYYYGKNIIYIYIYMIYFYYGKDLIHLILSLYHGAKVSVQILYSCVLVSGGMLPLPLCGRTKNASQANSLPVVQMPARWRGFVLKVLWMYLKVEKKHEFVHVHPTEQVSRLVCKWKIMLLAPLTEVPCWITRFNGPFLVTCRIPSDKTNMVC